MNTRMLKAVLSVALAAAVYFLLPPDCPEPARRTAFIFVLASFFWALEVIPLYATSLLVVIGCIFLLAKPGGVLGMDRSGYEIFLTPFGSPVIMLFFGGFILAAALHKYRIDALITKKLLSLFGARPYFIMLGFMIATAFLSMWMSNTATVAMMLVMIKPVLDKCDRDDPFRIGLVLAVAFAGNIGGIGTPIGTPPNAVAMGLLSDHGIHLNFLSWMAMGVPLAGFLLFVGSLILFLLFRPKHDSVDIQLDHHEHLSRRAWAVIAISSATVLLWLTSGFHRIPEAAVALLAVSFLTLSSLVDREDIRRIEWDVLVLMWGGLALGTGMSVSGFTQWIIGLPLFGYSGFWLVVIFGILAVLLSSFMSNTATANLLIPIVISFQGESTILLGVTVALCCSFAMAFPISTPPNALAFSTGIIGSRDMLKAGALISLISSAIVLAGFKWVIPFVFKSSMSYPL